MLKQGLTIEKLRDLPVIDKGTLRAATVPYHNVTLSKGDLIRSLTSGSSGQALEVFQSRIGVAEQWAIWARHKARFGISQDRDKCLTFGARVPIDFSKNKPPFWRINSALNQTYLSTYHLSPDKMGAIVDFISSNRFDYFSGYPTSMYVLASFMEENGLNLVEKPRMIITGSDALLPKYEKVINRTFGAPVTEQYGMAESCGNFSKCEFGNFHLDFEFGIAEFMDVEGSESSPMKRIVFTGLTNSAMPLIRYDVGDLAEPSYENCKCGRNSILIKRISGRQDDYIITHDGRRIQGLNQVLEWVENAREVQLVQKSIGEVEVQIIPTSDFVRERDLHKMDVEFERRFGDTLDIKYSLVDEIIRSKMGKYKAVISFLDQT